MNYISASVTVTQVESFGGILVQLRIYKTAHRISHLCLWGGPTLSDVMCLFGILIYNTQKPTPIRSLYYGFVKPSIIQQLGPLFWPGGFKPSSVQHLSCLPDSGTEQVSVALEVQLMNRGSLRNLLVNRSGVSAASSLQCCIISGLLPTLSTSAR